MKTFILAAALAVGFEQLVIQPGFPAFPLSVANGGTGAATLTGLLKGNGTSAVTAVTAGTASQVVLGDFTVGSVPGLTSQIGECNVRLTLTSGTPVTTADVTGAASVFVTPYLGNVCWFYDGASLWTALTFAEITVALGTLTSGLPYDIFCYNNSGAMACDAPLAWTNGTTRATALTFQNGVRVKSGATTRRFMGSFYTTATTTTEDSYTKAFLCNEYNRVPRGIRRLESTASWTYGTDTIRQANASTANQLAVLSCSGTDAINVTVVAHGYQNGAATALGFGIGIGENSTTANATGAMFNTVSLAAAAAGSDGSEQSTYASLSTAPATGYSYYAWLERSFNSTTTFVGISAGYNQSGITGAWVH